MRHTFTGLLAVAGLVLAPAGPAHAAAPDAGLSAAAVDAYLEEAVESTGLPGLSVVVTHGETVVHAAGYGHGSDGEPITEHTPMRIASMSKAFTAMAVMTLVDDGRISLDEPVAAQLPEFRMADERTGRITVRQLLNQTSGLSDTTVDVDAAQSTTSLSDYVATLADGELAAEPGSRWAYCNVNYDLAARVVEVASGQRFADYLADDVFAPLGMTDSAVSDRLVHPAEGYNSLYGAWVSRPELPAFLNGNGAGGVITTAADMGKWLVSQSGEGTQLVTPESLRSMHTAPDGQNYAMGWGEQTVDGVEMITHGGNLFTYTASAAVVPDTGYGFAVMANSAALHDDTFDVLRGLLALSDGRSPEIPGGDRQLVELVLGLLALGGVGLAVLGVVRARRWAVRRAGSPRWRIGLRLVPALLPVLVLAGYPDLVSFLMNGRRVTWAQLTYFAAPLTITVVVAAAAGVATVVTRLVRLAPVA
ncbi:serine hydrolase domain-containing protein [Actinophytocola xanthii]|uniref:Penicillin-binding protein n=1 Tax=Actinophytocola xanthii TaxID=1912961 RepID=A0A1Q8CR73_9PSEU|nr:serine hydrolase domain-containing protein [Actinophytocola xanthii]OLF16859.1 penicillin-binding protein [Actinophytocola xanthii]